MRGHEVFIVDALRTPIGKHAGVRWQRSVAARGLATLCIGIGQGLAVVLER